MNDSIFHNSKLQTAVKSIFKILKINFLQFANMRLLLTAKSLIGEKHYVDVGYRKNFFHKLIL